MSIEELDNKIQDFIEEMREFNRTISSNQLALVHRVDTLDLNGTAANLREFGNFLKDHPDFMRREEVQESKRVRQEIAIGWIREKLHLTDLVGKARWAATALMTGLLLAFGSQLVGLVSHLIDVVHVFGHTLFK